ncbi:MAG TPA: histidine kinase [Thermoanaerobaculia bacterium]|nr:histidine kinase [Thermoanaerobaculia bacterium]
MPSAPLHLRRLLTRALIIYGAWTLAGLFFATQHHILTIQSGLQDDFPERLMVMFISMTMWALATPFVMAFADRFPLSHPHRWRNAALSLAAALLVAAMIAPADITNTFFVARERVVFDGQFLKESIAVAHSHLLFGLVAIGIANFARLQRDGALRRRSAVQSRTALAHARLRRLQADLKPHFLFNSLNAVAALVHTDPPAAERTLDTLSDLLRRSIASEDALEVPLAEELHFVEDYLAIQKTRFGGRLQTAVYVQSPDLLTAAIPPFMIQPLVENAIVHGLSARRSTGAVEVRIRRNGRWLSVEVRDDGPGFDPDDTMDAVSVGVPHARARLRYLYGEEQALSFRRDDDAFVVSVRLPLRPVAATRGSEHAAA